MNRPVRQLVGYRRVHVAPGESVVVSFTVHADRSSFTGLRCARVVEPGTVTLVVGESREGEWPVASVNLVRDPRVVDHSRVHRSTSSVASGSGATGS